jgi:hypothetical protein
VSSVSRGASGLVLALGATACAGGASAPPAVLSDGSAARPPPVALEGIDGPSMLTRARVLRGDSIEPGSRTARCIEPTGASARAVVVRVGVNGASVTFLGRGGREMYGCDSSARAMDGSTWCGNAFGLLHAGRLRDPRLSLTCRGVDDDPLGFAWVQPTAAAFYVVVARPGYDEVYPVAGRLPVRVATEDVDLVNASAAFSVSEHAQNGRRLRSYVLEARVSG